MRIGIITQPLHANFGGILQAYALQTVLERMNHQVEIIERQPYNISIGHVLIKMSRRLVKSVCNLKKYSLFPDFNIKNRYNIEGKYTHQFINKYIHQNHIRISSDINEEDYDGFVVGSDQVWRPKYNYGRILDSYLKFTKGWNVKRISYAASFGTDDWEYTAELEQECKNLISKFNAVSVREESGVILCKEHYGIDAQHVLDPTLLLKAEDYVTLISGETPLKSSLVTYIMNETDHTKAVIEQISKEKYLKVVRTNSEYENRSAPLEKRIQPSVESWVNKFATADFIVTDSFHACVFSIIFHKQFIALSNVSRGNTRLLSLLRSLGIEDHLVDKETFDFSNDMSIIDYEKVDMILAQKQAESISFLQNSLS